MPTINIQKVELAKCGLALTPDGAGLIRIEPGQPGDDKPNPTWGAERLTGWAIERLGRSFRAERDATRLRYQAGHGFDQVRGLLKPEQQWIAWLKSHKVNPRHAWESIKLFEFFPDENSAARYRITEALTRAGAVVPRKQQRVHEPEAGLPPLTGSHKQIGWGETIRASALARLSEPEYAELRDWLKARTASSFWINCRGLFEIHPSLWADGLPESGLAKVANALRSHNVTSKADNL